LPLDKHLQWWYNVDEVKNEALVVTNPQHAYTRIDHW